MNGQQGIGLIEVLVALMLLAIGVLGYSALQLTAIKASDETAMRSQALSIMRGGAEIMRANPDGIATFKDALNTAAATNSLTVDNTQISKTSCISSTSGNTITTNVCTLNQLAARDAFVIKALAADSGVKVRAEECPSTGSGQPLTCLIAAWGRSNASIGSGTTDCVTSSGDYVIGSTCFVMEAY